MKLLILPFPNEYLIPRTLFFLPELPAFNKILINNGSQINLALEGIILDLLVELVKAGAQSVFEETLLHDKSFGIEFVIDVQPTWFAVHMMKWV